MWLGWIGLYQLSFVLALGFIPFLLMIRDHTKITAIYHGTEGGTRTHTVSPPPDFESGASTNSATPAQAGHYSKDVL